MSESRSEVGALIARLRYQYNFDNPWRMSNLEDIMAAAADALEGLVSAPTEAMSRETLGRIIWETSRADEGTISVMGANIIADAIIAAGGVSPVEYEYGQIVPHKFEDKFASLDEALEDGGMPGSILMRRTEAVPAGEWEPVK